MIEGIIGLIGVIIGSFIAYCSQHKILEQSLKYEELRYIKKLKLEKYEFILQDIKNKIRSYSFTSIVISKILNYYNDGILTEDILKKEIDIIAQEGKYLYTYLYDYDFLFNKKDLDLIRDSKLEKDCVELDLKVIPNINMTNIKDLNFRIDMKNLSVKANSIAIMYSELLNKVKLEMAKELNYNIKDKSNSL